MEAVDAVWIASERPGPGDRQGDGQPGQERKRKERKKVQLTGGDCLIPRLPLNPRRPVNIKVRLPDVRWVE